MEKYNRLWRFLFAISMIAIAVQQLICGDFRPVIVPPAFPAWLPGRLTMTWIFSIILIVACIAIIVEFKAGITSLVLGAVLLLLTLFLQVPYELGMYPAHLGSWTDPLKELALSGGAFVVAGSLPQQRAKSSFIKLMGKLIPAGKYFIAVTMSAFGIDHFLYPEFVATLVPSWIPGHMFWTYFAGTALFLAGIAIILNLKRRLAARLLGLMILSWFIILHIPRAIVDPHSGNGNEWTSVFEALAFSGIAFIIAGKTKKSF
ncbi:MAG: hypothetical protein ABJA90_05350 [Ginsengibacter sp.]